jgi:hypothetical protein
MSIPYLSTRCRGKLLVRFHSAFGRQPRLLGKMSVPWKKIMLLLMRSYIRKEKRISRAMATARCYRILMIAKALPSLAQLLTYMCYNKQADTQLLIYPTLPLLRYSLKANPITIPFLIACKLVKPMEYLPRIGRVSLALLGKSPVEDRRVLSLWKR